MAIKLQRVTTEYILIEDRIKLSGETPGGSPIVLWLTNRMALLAVPQLLRWLEDQAATAPGSSSAFPLARHEIQSFAQAAAVAKLKPRNKVTVEEGAPSWIVQAVDITMLQGRLSMTFRGEPAQSAILHLDATGLRQWLSILYRAWTKAQWSSRVWPDWFKSEEPLPHDVVRH